MVYVRGHKNRGKEITTMNLRPIKANMTELEIGDKTILFSYQTPVAYYEHGSYYVTNKKWSRTTSRHVNAWVNGSPVTTVNQETLNELVK